MEVIAVALSGGKDSTVTLHKIIKECNNNSYKKLFGAIIIDHNIRPESQLEAKQIEDYWSNRGIKIHIIRHQKGNLRNQKEARLFRLNELSVFAIKNGIHTIVLGHNLEDKLETYLMRKERSSTFVGLASISPVTYINQIKFIRPLLHTSRTYIDSYIKKQNLFFIEDGSNKKNKYKRNQIRHFTLPSINIRETLEEIRKNFLIRRNFQWKVEDWEHLHLIEIHNFAYKFIWNRLPVCTTFASMILNDIVHKVRGKAANWLDIKKFTHWQFKPTNGIWRNFHLNNVVFSQRGAYCYVEESLSDQKIHSALFLLFNHKLLLWSLNSKPVTIQNIKWPMVKINGIIYNIAHLQMEIRTEDFYCKIIKENYKVI